MSETVELKNCPFCGATPHKGPTKKEYDQLHGDEFQRYRIWCPHGHASVLEAAAIIAASAWNTRSDPAVRDRVTYPDNLISHRASWLKAMDRLIELEPVTGPPDEDERGFWTHEKNAMLAMYADIDRTSPPEPASGWMSMDSAPKDKLVMLAAEFPITGSGDWRMKVGGWREDRGHWEIFGASWKPTRWQPLPPPPAKEPQ